MRRGTRRLIECPVRTQLPCSLGAVGLWFAIGQGVIFDTVCYLHVEGGFKLRFIIAGERHSGVMRCKKCCRNLPGNVKDDTFVYYCVYVLELNRSPLGPINPIRAHVETL